LLRRCRNYHYFNEHAASNSANCQSRDHIVKDVAGGWFVGWSHGSSKRLNGTTCHKLPGRAHLRSAKNGDYNIPRVLSGFGQRRFSVSRPDAWNSLPRQLRGIAVSSTFKRHLKSELFFQAYGVSTIASTVADP